MIVIYCSHHHQRIIDWKMITIFAILLLGCLPFTPADPDPVLDFCIPESTPVQLNRLRSIPCKSPSNVTADDFVFSGIQSQGNFSPSTGFAGVAVNPVQFPALNTLGMSFARADFEPGGVNPPHYHPRATETAFVVEGSLYSGFVDSTGRVYAKVVEKGEVMVFPRGMVHFQMNGGDSVATIFGSFNSENPGLVKIPGTIFASGIKVELLETAFGLNEKELLKLKRRLRPS
ncbi:putative germin, rmlC-like cupin domain superfamily, rmlC-like jelly roll [Dioscorea sansibarensis]